MGKAICISGGAGFVGSNVGKRLSELGYNITVVDNLLFGYEENIDFKCTFYRGGIETLDEEYLSTFDILIASHCVNIIYAMEYPIHTFETNSVNTLKMFSKFKGKIINLSTASIYGNADIFPTSENSPSKCYNSYDNSKLIGELFLKQRGNYTNLRLSNVYGRNQHPNHPYSGVIGKMIGCALKNEPIKIMGNGTQTRDMTYIDDVVDAIMLSVEQGAKNTDINIASGKEITIKELATKIWESVNRTQKIESTPERTIDVLRRRWLNVERAKYELGWIPKTSLYDGIKKTVEWAKSNNGD